VIGDKSAMHMVLCRRFSMQWSELRVSKTDLFAGIVVLTYVTMAGLDKCGIVLPDGVAKKLL
jgi:hypothetical protein